jgi:hypothetical protein
MSIYYSTVMEDPSTNELFIELPEELVKLMNWSDNTTLVWTVKANNSIFISETK